MRDVLLALAVVLAVAGFLGGHPSSRPLIDDEADAGETGFFSRSCDEPVKVDEGTPVPALWTMRGCQDPR